MENQTNFINLEIGEVCHGFKLSKKEHVTSKGATLYTLRHEKTGAELLYFDRADENKTFCVAFKTLPEDNTGVFHILEHSVLNGSKKFPVKEPFLSMLQSSMQTFLNAMTYSDKTVFPVSSRNEKDFFNLMQVYLDAVFCPMIYQKPEIFMQEGWHYEFDEDGVFYNGVVFSEMKGAFSDVDSLIDDATAKLVFPDNSYGFTSGGHPDNITDLTYEKFVATHKRFYHPTNAKFFLDGHMNIDTVLEYIDGEYLCKYDYKEPDFDFSVQSPVQANASVYYEAREGEEDLAHVSIGKILGLHSEVEKTYAAEILADYLTGSNEAPLKRAFLESGIAQDANLIVNAGVYQPMIMLVANNVEKARIDEVGGFVVDAVKDILAHGLDKKALSASLERYAFTNKEITEPYGVELAIKALDGWLYGDDPLTHIDNAAVFDSLREKIDTDYFASLLKSLLLDDDGKCCLYALPSLTKGEDDAQRESEKVNSIAAKWSDDELREKMEATEKMQIWQQSVDSEEELELLPHLSLDDVQASVRLPEKFSKEVGGVETLKISLDTNGIVYLNMFFDISDFTEDELFAANFLATCIGELSTENYNADALQTEIKANLGSLSGKIELTAKTGDLENCKPYFVVSASMLEEKVPAAIELIKEVLEHGVYTEVDKMCDLAAQRAYALKQSLLGDGHIFAMIKSLSAYSAKGALKETLEGESFVKKFTDFTEHFAANSEEISLSISNAAKKIFLNNRLFIGYSGEIEKKSIEALITALPTGNIGTPSPVLKAEKNSETIKILSGVGYSALGHNLYALGKEYTGACAVLSSPVSYTYLWNAVRVQGGAYGTGMNIRSDGDIFSYSYRDPDLENTKAAFGSISEFLTEFLAQDAPLDDVIIGTVNTTDPLIEPAERCVLECLRHLEGRGQSDIERIRKEILSTDTKALLSLVDTIKMYEQDGKFCEIGG